MWEYLAVLGAIGVVLAYFLFVYNGGAVGARLFGGAPNSSSPNPDGPQTLVGFLQGAYATTQSSMEAGSNPYASVLGKSTAPLNGAENPFDNLLARGPSPTTSASINGPLLSFGVGKTQGPMAASSVPTAAATSHAISNAPSPNSPTLTLSPYTPSISKIKSLSFGGSAV